MPAPLRDVLLERGGGKPVPLMLLRWLDPCLRLYVAEDWEAEEEAFESRAEDLLDLDDTLANLRRVIFSLATPVDLDKNSRILIRPNLREHAGLQDAIVWVGQGRYIELWEPSRWRARIESALQDRDGLRRNLKTLGARQV
jgi:MraZ protein